jgi:hypothetical protein
MQFGRGLSLIAALAILLVGTSASANSIVGYQLDVTITRGDQFGVGTDDILLDAGRVDIDLSGVTGSGVETADITNFSLTIGTETWGWFAAPTVPHVPGYGSYPTLNLAIFSDGVLSELNIASLSGNGILLELGGTFNSAGVADLSLMADNYYVGEVLGSYEASAHMPEPSAALAFGIGCLVVGSRLRRR